MRDDSVSKTLLLEAKKILKGFRDGSLSFNDYMSGCVIPSTLAFDEWIADLDGYLKVDPSELQGNKPIIAVKKFLPTMREERIRSLVKNPKLITEDEGLEWRRNWHKDDQLECDFYSLVPIRPKDSVVGAVIICTYSMIPDGEFEIAGVFNSVQEATKYFNRYTFDS